MDVVLRFFPHKLFNRLPGASAHILVALVGEFIVGVVQPGIHIGLECLDTVVERFSQGDREEFCLDGPVKALNEAIGRRMPLLMLSVCAM